MTYIGKGRKRSGRKTRGMRISRYVWNFFCGVSKFFKCIYAESLRKKCGTDFVSMHCFPLFERAQLFRKVKIHYVL